MGAAEDWGTPPWVIRDEPPNQWTKIKWVWRRNYLKEQLAKKAQQDEKLNGIRRKHSNKRNR